MGTCCTAFKNEFKVSHLGLNHPNPTLFVTSQHKAVSDVGHVRSILYIVYRFVMALYFLSVWIYGVYYKGSDDFLRRWVIYFTYWAYTTLTLNVILLSVTSVIGYLRPPKEMTWYLKMSWCLYYLSSVSSIFVAILFWSVVYTGWALNIDNFTTHAISTAYVILDAFIIGIPVRILHVYQAAIFGALYIAFSAIYWAAGGTNRSGGPYIYSLLDYGKTPALSAGIGVGTILIVVPLLHLIVFGIYKLRVFLYGKCAREKVSPNTHDENENSKNSTELCIQESVSHPTA